MSKFHDIAFTKSLDDMTPAERRLVEHEINRWAEEVSAKPFGSRKSGYSPDVLEMQAIELAKRAKQLRSKRKNASDNQGKTSTKEDTSIWSPQKDIWSGE